MHAGMQACRHRRVSTVVAFLRSDCTYILHGCMRGCQNVSFPAWSRYRCETCGLGRLSSCARTSRSSFHQAVMLLTPARTLSCPFAACAVLTAETDCGLGQVGWIFPALAFCLQSSQAGVLAIFTSVVIVWTCLPRRCPEF